MKQDVSSQMPQLLSTLSRRHMLLLAGTVILAACQPDTTASSSPPPTPTSNTLPALKQITKENASHLKQVALLDGDQNGIRGVCWSPDGKLLAFAPANKIIIWQSSSAKQIATLQGHTGSINGLGWSPDGKLLASVSDDGTARLWQTADWKPAATLSIQRADDFDSKVALSLAWSPDSQQLVAGKADGSLQRWNVTTGKSLGLWRQPTPANGFGGRYPFGVWGIAWSPDGKHVVSNRYDKHTFVWDTSNGKMVRELPPQDQPNGVAYTRDGQFVATSNDVGTIQLWDTSGKNIKTLRSPDGAGWAYPVMWSPDGTLLATACAHGLVEIWDTQTGQRLAAIQGHNAGVYTGGWSVTGTLIATGSDDGTVRLWGVI